LSLPGQADAEHRRERAECQRRGDVRPGIRRVETLTEGCAQLFHLVVHAILGVRAPRIIRLRLWNNVSFVGHATTPGLGLGSTSSAGRRALRRSGG
jgi:hypothetical protein